MMDSTFWPILLVLTEYAIRLGLVAHLLLRRRARAMSNLAWIAVILAVPIVGMVGYLLIGEVRLGRRRIRRHAEIVQRITASGSYADAHVGLDWDSIPENYRHLATLADAVGEMGAIGGNRLEIVGETDAFIQMLIDDIDHARDHCHLLFYIYLADHSGRKVADALKRAAERGVACRLLIDAVGSSGFLASNLPRELTGAGVQVVPALSVNLLRTLFARIDLRNHRKIVVIDGQVAYTGSQNIADAAFAIKPRFAPWYDAMVRLEGPAARDLQALFIEDWYLDTDDSLESLLSIHPEPHEDGVAVQVMGTGPNSFNEALRQLILSAIHTAREELILTTPYFVPDDATVIALCTAARRGAATRLVVPKRNDSRFVAAASRSYYERLLEAGVEIAEFRSGLLHAKTLTLDRQIALVSSANLDRRSFELNFEVSLLVYDSDFASKVRFLQSSYLAESDMVQYRDWINRPMPIRLWQNAAGLLGPLL